MNSSAPAGPAVDWLLGEARFLPSGPATLKELGLRLNAAGIDLARASFHVRTLHPQLYGLGFYWYRGRDDIRVFQAGHDTRDSDMYRLSPMRLLFNEGVKEIRESLERDASSFTFPLYAELKAQGFTDYLALPLTFSDGKVHGTTWSTDRKGGFHEDEIRLIKAVLPAFSLLIEIHLNRRIAVNLLDAYVGHQAGERILAGQITRGSGETIPAAIWFSDLRGFTAMSETTARDELLDRLNLYFDAVAGPVTERGGEILKFIGDAMLAIFPLAVDGACANALAAAIEAEAALAALNRERSRTGAPPLAAGIALHVGEVMYGNIGSATRLDFTVIGPAVNLASRIEGLCKTLGPSILLSDDFAARCMGGGNGGGAPLRSLGRHHLRGIAREIEIFSPEATA
ncbi:MAG: adenylate/guanylate cyclase domain-containing protein [Alphaproteobacteria bacterium]